MKLNKKVAAGVLSGVLFLAYFGAALFYVDRTLEEKGELSAQKIRNFYKIKRDSLEVIFLGSSHSHCTFDPYIFWKQEGIPSYNLGLSSQPFWNSYYLLKEALKYQKPKIVVLEALACAYSYEYDDAKWRFTKEYWNTHGLRLSENKIEAIFASDNENHMRANLLAGLPIYHARRDLTQQDFWVCYWPENVWFNGYSVTFHITPWKRPQIIKINDSEPIPYKEREYLLKIIAFTKTENITLLLVAAPDSNRFATQPDCIKKLNALKNIAYKQNIAFVNYNTDTFFNTLDFSTDISDWGEHLNTYGATKVSLDLARYLKEHYSLPDHRADPAYASWNTWAAACQKALDEAAKGMG